jgi:competence protein ComER
MGSILIEAFIQSGALNPEQIIASNRTTDKARRLAEAYPGLRATSSNVEAVQGADMVFLCIKPAEYMRVLAEIRSVAEPGQIFVSITSPVLLKHLESMLPGKVMKMIPSITNYVLSGATLVIYGERMQQADKDLLENMLTHISVPLCVEEEHTRICSDLSSCGPAFLSYFVQQFIEAAVSKTGIPRSTAIQLVGEMVLGTGKLLTTGGFNPSTLQSRVTVPGGITEAGLQLMSSDLDGMFERLVAATHAKYDEDVDKIERQFAEVQNPQ